MEYNHCEVRMLNKTLRASSTIHYTAISTQCPAETRFSGAAEITQHVKLHSKFCTFRGRIRSCCQNVPLARKKIAFLASWFSHSVQEIPIGNCFREKWNGRRKIARTTGKAGLVIVCLRAISRCSSAEISKGVNLDGSCWGSARWCAIDDAKKLCSWSRSPS